MSQLNRRQFLSAGVLGTAAWAWETHSAVPGVSPWPAGKSRSLQKAADPVATLCVACDAHCPLLAYRNDGRVVQVGPHAIGRREATLCARAYEQVEALYDPERLVQPLVRTGARGEGSWQVISWQEALVRVRTALQAGPERAWVELGRPDPLAVPLLDTLGVRKVAGWHPRREHARRLAETALYGAPLAQPELADVRTVLLVGCRPWDEGSVFAPLARALARVKVDGAEVVACGSYQGATGSVASRWVPLRPGSEASLLLGLAHLLWREAGSASLPASLGEELALHTPAAVAAATGLNLSQLADLARRFQSRGPSVCLAEAATADTAGVVATAAALLNEWVAGGASRLRLEQQEATLLPPLDREAGVDEVAAGAFVPLYLAYRANPVYRAGEAARAGFADPKRVGLLVAMDTHLTETAQRADLVLPAAADLELWNLFQGPTGPRLQQPAPRAWSEAAWLRSQQTAPAVLFDGPPNGPLGEARQLGDVLLALGGEADGGRSVGGTVTAEAARLGVDPAVGGVGAAGVAAPVPQFASPLGTVPVTSLGTGGEDFALLVLEPQVLDPAYPNSAWGREARTRNPLYIHQDVAARLGLHRGAWVELRGSETSLTAQVEPVAGIHPEALAVATGYGHWAGGVVAAAAAAAGAAAGAAVPGSLGPSQPKLPWWHPEGSGSRAVRPAGQPRVTLHRL